METSNITMALLRQAFPKLALTGLACTFGIFTAFAQDTDSANKEKEITVTPVGVNNSELVFNLKHLNPGADKIFVTLSDKYGDRLYSEQVNTKNFDKTFKVNSEVGTVFLVVTNIRTKAQEKFEISPRTRMVEDLSVNNVY
ncbi:MAG: hypothetical protein INR73_14825 [Williamsia sp.]|nr:hypothetical protein [Williamsia sp.]